MVMGEEGGNDGQRRVKPQDSIKEGDKSTSVYHFGQRKDFFTLINFHQISHIIMETK